MREGSGLILPVFIIHKKLYCPRVKVSVFEKPSARETYVSREQNKISSLGSGENEEVLT